MSWCKKTLVLVALSVMLLLINACSGGLSSEQQSKLGSIAIEASDTRIGQLYRQRLSRLFASTQKDQIRYELIVELRSSDTDETIDMIANITLYDREQGENLIKKSLFATASVGAVPSLYGEEEAKRFANERLAQYLADKTYNYLLLYFLRTSS